MRFLSEHPSWRGWYVDGEYIVDDCGNKFHPLVIKCCHFDRQRTGPSRLLYRRPQWDD